MSAHHLALRFPELKNSLPLTKLGCFPTPVEEARDLAGKIGVDPLWIKRDDLSGKVYGGNKVRKLELLFGKALKDRKSWVVTAGAWGSHHVLATSIYGRTVGLRVRAVLCPQPVTDHVLENLLCTHESGAHIVAVRSPAAVTPSLLYETARTRGMLIPPGGSSPLGALAFANAGLELAEQIRAGELPEPERIYVALGSNGTMAGLIVGIGLAQLRTKVIGVRVTDSYMANEFLVAGLATQTAKLLRKLAPSAPKLTFSRREIEIIHDQFGKGYGHETQGGQEAQDLANDHAQLLLDPTYTGKAMAGLMADAKERPPTGPILFWSTLSSAHLGPLLSKASAEGLPKPLTKLF